MSRKTLIIIGVIVALAAAVGAYFVFNDGGMQTASSGNSGTAPKYEALPTDHTMGDPKAKVVVIEYASPTCPVCANFMANFFPTIERDYIAKGKVFWVYRTLLRNPDDGAAEKLARCMPKDKYMSFTDTLFKNQSRWDYEFGIPTPDGVHAALLQLASEAGMSNADADRCMASTAEDAAINKVVEDGVAKYQVSATPTFVINGATVVGFEDIYTRLDAAVAAK